VGVQCQFVPDRICHRTEVLARRVPLRMCLLDDASLIDDASPYDPYWSWPDVILGIG
jgi:hypothetical protein